MTKFWVVGHSTGFISEVVKWNRSGKARSLSGLLERLCMAFGSLASMQGILVFLVYVTKNHSLGYGEDL